MVSSVNRGNSQTDRSVELPDTCREHRARYRGWIQQNNVFESINKNRGNVSSVDRTARSTRCPGRGRLGSESVRASVRDRSRRGGHSAVDFSPLWVVKLVAIERFSIRRDSSTQVEIGPADYVTCDEEGAVPILGRGIVKHEWFTRRVEHPILGARIAVRVRLRRNCYRTWMPVACCDKS